MIILTTTLVEQEFKIIPRKYMSSGDTITVVVTDENTRTSTTFDVSGTTVINGHQIIHGTFNLFEGRFYILEVKLINELLYRGRIFCTDQTDYPNYDMNKDQFITNDGDNIIII